MRVGGLASGIDTESIIKDLMKAQRIPLDKVTQKKQYFEWQLNDTRSANRDLKDFSTKLFDNMILSKNFNQKNVTVSAPDDVSIRSKGNTENFSGTINVQQLAKSATFNGGQEDNKNKVLDADSSINIKAPGDNSPVKVLLSKGDTMKDVVKKINENSSVRSFYDEETGKIGFTAKQSGEGSIIITEGEAGGTLAADLGIAGSSDTSAKGQDAIFNYNGMEITRSSNTFELDGMEITLKAANNKDITFNATTDTEKVFENVKQFVDDYNKLIEDLNKKIREPKYRNFQPLSTEQKADMKEKEIELWEEKAMSGTLRGNPELTSLLTSMRTALNSSVEVDGKQVSLSSIGITTSKDYSENGKLIIDETKLKEAISQNPENVQKLFGFEDKVNPEKSGIARLLRKEVDATQQVLQKKAGKVGDSNKAFTLGRTLDDMNKQIERFEDRMKMVESRYWKQFTAMENAIQRANMQSANLMNALGGGA
ncbi:flagellar hook-associated protein 2 [Sporosarcina aquimarina]|uniref:Flagellar hook-associated protein 2 n=1 Tax=Sporosarcina aquimarina TaxID=114975 RepID=A0ABU4G3C7_9BACL|nr:flagellar hook-associated protein 2 [Sporosarcina aquimarina]MDW0111464.1 flagellar hook-associated protein 2 [Sporosarcina aquimarina]